VEDDLRRRDFTVNAIARRLADDTLVDPFGGRDDLARGVLRTVSQRSFAEDPLRLVRGLRFVSQLGLEPDETTLEQMREEAEGVRLVSGERIGGGLAADGLGELSKLLLGREPARALRLARDTGVLVALIPEFAPAVGFDQRSRYHDLTVDEHTFAVVQAAADLGFPLRVRLAALLHDLGKPVVAWEGRDGRLHFYAKPGVAPKSHETVGAEIAGAVLGRLRYPNELRSRVCAIVRHHMLDVGKADALRASRLLARYGEALTFDLLDHTEADLRGKRPGGRPPTDDLARLAAFRQVVEVERSAPHRLRDLAVGGDDLIAAGFPSGPEIGRVLRTLLEDVVHDPSLNTRDELLRRAEVLRA
jgi:putative nucleotidyltransferase with HDIG domain